MNRALACLVFVVTPFIALWHSMFFFYCVLVEGWAMAFGYWRGKE